MALSASDLATLGAYGVIEVGVLTILAQTLIYHDQTKRTAQDKKKVVFQDLIAAAEDLRDAYFDGEPDPDCKNPKHARKDFTLNQHGWTRPDPWINQTKTYKKGLLRLNQALAGMTLSSPQKITEEAFKIETYALTYRGSIKRREYMNHLTTLMQKDLKIISRFASESELEWF